MTDRFVAVDVETANPDLASICQVGVVVFENGAPSSTWESLVGPEEFFDPWNVEIHGITEDQVAGAPTMPEILPQLRTLLQDQVVVSHMPFDRVAFGRVAEKYGFALFPCRWLDSARVVRRAWPQFSRTGYALAKCTNEFGITFRHHVASEDARAAGLLVAKAIEETGLSLDEWLVRVEQPISPSGPHPSQHIARQGNPDGPLAGEVVAFTGALTIPRAEAADLAADSGCTVSPNVTKKTTLLVVGEQDIRLLAGHRGSSKHRKAEALIADGQHIRVLGENDFRRLVKETEG